MKKNEKIVIGVLVVITVILIIVAIVNNSNGSEETEGSSANSTTQQTNSTNETTEEDEELEEAVEEEEEVEEYVSVSDDGTKVNTSEKLSETKTIDGIEITGIELTESGNVTQLLATMTNTSDETQGGYVAVLTLIDEDGNVLLEMNPYIAELEPGESTQLNTSATFDYANAYDFTIEKKSE